MALVQCPECGQQVSDQAESCPKCGMAIKPVLIEQTGKKWKAIKLVSWLLFLTGFFTMISGAGNEGFNNPWTGFGLLLAFVGLITIIIAKFGSWWNYK